MDKAKKYGRIEIKELMECLLSQGITDRDQIDDILEMIQNMGISVAH